LKSLLCLSAVYEPLPLPHLVQCLTVLGGMPSLRKRRSGLAFSEFRGYEDWRVVAVSQTEEEIKVIVA